MKTIVLTTPYRGYAEVKLVRRRDEEKRKHLFVEFEYGDTVAGKWVAGELHSVEKLIKNIGQALDGKGGEIRPADPQYDKLVEGGAPRVTFTNKGGNKRWKKLTRPHPVHGDLDMWVQVSQVALVRNIYEHALVAHGSEEAWFVGSIQ